MHDIRKWQRALSKLLAAIKKNNQDLKNLKEASEVDLEALEESEKALQENSKAMESLKQPRLKEY